jgi:hypothetical protein
MLLAGFAYLWRFVDRGWIPHDEGQLGQSAEFVLRGGLPHVAYQEAYTGALSQLYAAVFALLGTDLLHVRRMLFAGAVWAVVLVYALCRRHLPPVGAAVAAWVALAWSFPNYFAGLPSWWLLICALTCLWALVRYDETLQWRYLVGAGLSAGAAVAIKQTGVYLVLALAMCTAYASLPPGASRHSPAPPGSWSRSSSRSRLARWSAWGLALVVVAFTAGILGDRLPGTEGLFLGLPVIACAVALAWRAWRGPGRFTGPALCASAKKPRSTEAPRRRQKGRGVEGGPVSSASASDTAKDGASATASDTAWHSAPALCPAPSWPASATLAALAAASIPLALFLLQYAAPDLFAAWFDGAVLRPRLRLASAAVSMPDAATALQDALLPLLLALASVATPAVLSWLIWWPLAAAWPTAALNDARAFQQMWQSARVVAVLLPILAAWRVCRPGRVERQAAGPVAPGAIAPSSLADDQCLPPTVRGRESAVHGERGPSPFPFFAAAVLALVSLNQHPFAAPVYFVYTTPLAVVCGVAVAHAFRVAPRVLAPWAVLLLLFAALGVNPGYIVWYSASNVRMPYDAPMNLPRAHLRVSDQHAYEYQRLMKAIEDNLHGGKLIAGPDSPEVYFLAGQESPGGVMYEFLGGPVPRELSRTSLPLGHDISYWKHASVIVVNLDPPFSPALPEELMEQLRHEFPKGEWIDRFEVRWR